METALEVSEDWLEMCFGNPTIAVSGSTPGQTSAVSSVGPGMAGSTPIQSNIRHHKTNNHRKGSEDMNGIQDTLIRPASKPHSTPLTLKWLEDNYEIADGVCIPRSTLYLHYLDYCNTNDTQPVNAASFGKIIRQQFPQITTRRLGTRGQSKYHYYGIGVKENSIYYDLIYSRKGVQNVAEGKKDSMKQVVSYSPRSKLGTLLPEFPEVDDLVLPANITEEKVATFLMMYRTHCQRILDTVIRANFDEVQSFLLHFWQGMPQHIIPILGSTVIVDLIGFCDSILYRTISSVLMPSILQTIPDSLIQVIRKFARQLNDWLTVALHDLPEGLRQMKMDMARRFSQALKRQASLNHLCQASRTVIQSPEITCQMVEDWNHVDLASICKQTLYTMDRYKDSDHDVIVMFYREFEDLINEQAPLEAYTKWLDSMVDRCIRQPATKKPECLRRVARQFLLMWSCFGTRVIRDMTLQSAPSFGSFHLLHLMFDDFVLYLVESLLSQERTNDLLRSITGQSSPPGSYHDDTILPRSSSFLKSTSSLLSPSNSDNISTVPQAPYVQERQTVITDARVVYASTNARSCALPTPQPSPAATSIQHSISSCSSSGMPAYESRTNLADIQQMSPKFSNSRAFNRQSNNIQPMTDPYDTYGTASRRPANQNIADYSSCPYSYYGYQSRDCNAISLATDWSDCRQRYNERGLPSRHDYQTNYYASYGYSRPPTDYEVAMYGYTAANGSVMRSNTSGETFGATYPHCLIDSSTASHQSSTDSMEAAMTGRAGKRKSIETANDRNFTNRKQRHLANDYAYEPCAMFSHGGPLLHQTQTI